MFIIKLPDGSKQKYAQKPNCFEIAKSISPSLAKKAIAAIVNNKPKDLSYYPDNEDEVSIITTDSKEGLEIIRHDAAHVLAQAVKEIYGDKVQITIGPTIENGFYYDFAYNDASFSTEDLEKIEVKMQEIIKQGHKFQRKTFTKKEAIKHFESLGEKYKVEIIKDLKEEEEVSVYFQGNHFSDLCRGPHAPSVKYIKAFKLLKVSGAYWRGNSKNQMLQRIYGTAWPSKTELDQYIQTLKEAEKRDHRKLGKEMDLFHFNEEAPGCVFWHPKGWTLFQNLVSYMREKQNNAEYQEINTPEIMDKTLWEKSGHWDKFNEHIFVAEAPNEERIYAVRPMNCPGGVELYNHGITSYKQLPIRLSEFGKVYRYEPSGALHGLMRVRGFTQDDAHIFCTKEQMIEESLSICKLMLEIYKDFGFKNIKIKFSTRPEKRIGSDEVWDQAEDALLTAIKKLETEYRINPGEGAFYGPKIEFALRDAMNREWQMGTVQMDFNLPKRLNANFIDQDGQKIPVIMLHRAVFGSLERFIGILLEHYGGKLPLWLAPIQVAVLSISEKHTEYAKEVTKKLQNHNIKTIIDYENETLSYRIRKYSLSKIPIICTLGDKELKDDTISFRKIGSKQNFILKTDEFIQIISNEVKSKAF